MYMGFCLGVEAGGGRWGTAENKSPGSVQVQAQVQVPVRLTISGSPSLLLML